MSKIVELDSKELHSVSGGDLLGMAAVAGIASSFYGLGRFLSDYQNNACDTWQETGRSSKFSCYAGNALLEGLWHGVGDAFLISQLPRFLERFHIHVD